MAPVIHISEAEAAGDFASVLARVRAGAEVVIETEGGKLPVAVIHRQSFPAAPSPSASRCYPRTRQRSWMPDFAKDVEAAIESHREPLEPPAWD